MTHSVKKMGDASIQVIRENRGAAVRTIGYLKELLRLTATESMVNTHYKISTRNINDEVSPRMRPWGCSDTIFDPAFPW